MANAETHTFQAEARELLALMIHSVYSNKEIFLRELISNASDAVDKLRFEALTKSDLKEAAEPGKIRIAADATLRTLTISDNGIGMNREELVRNIGTIARSGTREVLEKMKAQGNKPELIGQFGVGFYSVFMVASKVELLTRRAGETEASLWSSEGDGRYTVEAAQKPEHGTTITLHLKPVDAEDGMEDFTEHYTLERIVKRYSDFVTYPVVLEETGKEPKTLNSMKPIWARPQNEVTADEYTEFYKHISHDWQPPLKHIPFRAEGTFEYQALLFLPEKAPFDLFFRDAKNGLQLYVKRVLIMEACEELLPHYLRFVRGVVDAADLPLNVSRELLQQNRHLAAIRKRLAKKVIDTLVSLSETEPAQYDKAWKEFGPLLKEGAANDGDNREKLLTLLRFESSRGEAPSDPQAKLVTLKDYVSRMGTEQSEIYYITAESRPVAENSPHLEAFKEKGIEVLLLIEPIDELLVQTVGEFEGKKFKSVNKGDVSLGDDKTSDTTKEKYASLSERVQKSLDEYVREVRLSSRLRASPACLVCGDNDMSPHLERLLQQTQRAIPKQKRILELNPTHPLVEALQKRAEKGEDALLSDYAYLIYGQALLAEGSPLPDANRFGKLVGELIVRAETSASA